MANVRWISYPRVSSCDVLQSSGSGLSRCGVDLAAHQHLLIKLQYLRVPEPLHIFGLPWHFFKCGKVLILSLEKKTQCELRLKFENENCICKQLLTSLAFLLLGVKQPIASPFFEMFWARLGPSSRLSSSGLISVYSWKDRFLNTHTAFSTPWERNTLMNGHVNTHLADGGNNRGRI